MLCSSILIERFALEHRACVILPRPVAIGENLWHRDSNQSLIIFFFLIQSYSTMHLLLNTSEVILNWLVQLVIQLKYTGWINAIITSGKIEQRVWQYSCHQITLQPSLEILQNQTASKSDYYFTNHGKFTRNPCRLGSDKWRVLSLGNTFEQDLRWWFGNVVRLWCWVDFSNYLHVMNK